MKIALMGYSRSGKDTIFEILQKRNKKTTRLAFGDGLREIVKELFPKLPANPKPRNVYETVGSMMRQIEPDYWVKKLEEWYKFELRVNKMFKNDFDFVITDLRQPNEAAWARANGFVIVYVHSKDEIRRARAAEDAEFNIVNKSEAEIWTIDPDLMIINNGTLEELEVEVDRFLEVMEGYSEYMEGYGEYNGTDKEA